MPGKVYHLTDRNEFKQFLLTNKNFVIKFTATWCGPCKTAKPIIDNYFNQSKQYLDMVLIYLYEKNEDLIMIYFLLLDQILLKLYIKSI